MTNIHFRLTRKGDVYNVSINGEVVVGKTIPDKGAFEEVRIGLTGEKSTIRARVYSIKITSLEKDVPKPAALAAPLPGVREDFGKATAGSLPDGWTASKAANLAVQKSGDNADLELVDPALGGDIVMLPKVELKGDFYADVAAVLTEGDTAVEVFFKGAKTKMLAVELGFDGAVTVAGYPKADGSKSWVYGKPNVLRLEALRKGQGLFHQAERHGGRSRAAGYGAGAVHGSRPGRRHQGREEEDAANNVGPGRTAGGRPGALNGCPSSVMGARSFRGEVGSPVQFARQLGEGLGEDRTLHRAAGNLERPEVRASVADWSKRSVNSAGLNPNSAAAAVFMSRSFSNWPTSDAMGSVAVNRAPVASTARAKRWLSLAKRVFSVASGG